MRLRLPTHQYIVGFVSALVLVVILFLTSANLRSAGVAGVAQAAPSSQEEMEQELIARVLSKLDQITETQQQQETYTLYEVPRTDSDIFSRGSCPSSTSSSTDHFLSAVNKQQSVGDYTPPHLVEIQDQIRTKDNRAVCLEEYVALALKQMFDDALLAGHTLIVTSGFRDHKTQMFLYQRAVELSGYNGTRRVATPFHSEHYLGTTIDVTGASLQSASASGTFGDSPEGRWVAENSYKYGFIMSYPKGAEHETGYMFEPWHFRYVGPQNAEMIHDSQITLHTVLTNEDTEIVPYVEEKNLEEIEHPNED